jgi:CHASE2 domain-containing sensor protein
VYRFRAKLLSNLPSLVVIAGLLLLRSYGWLQSLELAALDRMMRLRPPEALDDRVVIIGIQESDIQQIRRYPISDQILAETLTRIQRLQPAAIGLDIFRDLPVPPGEAQFTQAVQSIPNLFVVYRQSPDSNGTSTSGPQGAPNSGFVDVPLDPDGNVRRMFLGLQDAAGNGHISLPAQLSSAWLDQHQQEFESTDTGLQMGDRQYSFVTAHFAGYHQIDDGGDQVLLNPRNQLQPFRQFSLADVRSGKLRPEQIRGKVVLIGLTATSIKDVVNSQAFPESQNAQVNGVEVQAHAASQLISAVHDRRPMIQAWNDPIENLWIIAWGVGGLLVGYLGKSLGPKLGGLLLGLMTIGGVSYGLLLYGWWIPVLPATLAFLINAGGFVVAQVYQQERDLRSRLRDRQQVLEQTFTAVHNGPLQDLAGLTRQLQDQPLLKVDLPAAIVPQLQKINQDLRHIFAAVQMEIVDDRPNLYLAAESQLNLDAPIHELLQQVYNATCANELAGLSQIKIKVIRFDPLPDAALTPTQKRSLCQFLEEALRNVGKHAPSATKLWVHCGVENQRHVICVKDNGGGAPSQTRLGGGTKQAQQIAKQLRGKFQRCANQPQGVICQLTW